MRCGLQSSALSVITIPEVLLLGPSHSEMDYDVSISLPQTTVSPQFEGAVQASHEKTSVLALEFNRAPMLWRKHLRASQHGYDCCDDVLWSYEQPLVLCVIGTP
jgi:hypothetical protein